MENRIMGWLPLVVFVVLAALGTAAGIMQSQS
jgi:hypothetical protein